LEARHLDRASLANAPDRWPLSGRERTQPPQAYGCRAPKSVAPEATGGDPPEEGDRLGRAHVDQQASQLRVIAAACVHLEHGYSHKQTGKPRVRDWGIAPARELGLHTLEQRG